MLRIRNLVWSLSFLFLLVLWGANPSFLNAATLNASSSSSIRYKKKTKPILRYEQLRFGMYFSTIGISFLGEESKEGVTFLSTELDIRYYTSGTLFFGSRVFMGQNKGAGASKGTNTLGLVVEPIIGLHWTDQSLGEVGVPYKGSSRFSSGYYRYRTYKGSVLGIKPFLGLMGKGYIGGHLTWEYYGFTERDEDIEDIAASVLSHRKKMYMLEGELRIALSVGYISGMGAGGNVRGTLTTGMFHLAFTLGFYYGDSVSVFVLPTVGLLFQ